MHWCKRGYYSPVRNPIELQLLCQKKSDWDGTDDNQQPKLHWRKWGYRSPVRNPTKFPLLWKKSSGWDTINTDQWPITYWHKWDYCLPIMNPAELSLLFHKRQAVEIILEENAQKHISFNLSYLFHSKLNSFICINMSDVWILTSTSHHLQTMFFSQSLFHHEQYTVEISRHWWLKPLILCSSF